MSQKLKLFFTISVLLNLLLIGTLAGFLFRCNYHGGPSPAEMTKLSPEGKALMTESFQKSHDEMGDVFDQARAARADVITILQADTFDKKAFDGLGADDQKAVEAEFRSGFARLDQINRDDNVAARDALKQQGIAITAPDAGERARWEAVGAEVFRKLSEQGSLSPDMLKALTGALDDVRGSH